MEDLINKRVLIAKGHHKGEFGTILEIKKVGLNNEPSVLLIELNSGKILEYSIDDLAMKWDYKNIMEG